MRHDRTLPISTQLLATARGIASGPTGAGVIASLAIVVLAGIVAPGESPGWWTWLRVLVIWLLAAGALGTIAAVRAGAARIASPLVVWGALLLAILISLSLGALTAALTGLALLLLLITVPSSGPALPFWAAAATMIPLWVWSAFGAWDRWLLMLLTIAAIGLVSLEHAARAGRGGQAERLAAWIGPLALAAAVILVGLVGSVDPSWLTAAAIAVAALAIVDLALARLPTLRLSPVILPAVALAALGLGWMAAL